MIKYKPVNRTTVGVIDRVQIDIIIILTNSLEYMSNLEK